MSAPAIATTSVSRNLHCEISGMHRQSRIVIILQNEYSGHSANHTHILSNLSIISLFKQPGKYPLNASFVKGAVCQSVRAVVFVAVIQSLIFSDVSAQVREVNITPS